MRQVLQITSRPSTTVVQTKHCGLPVFLGCSLSIMRNQTISFFENLFIVEAITHLDGHLEQARRKSKTVRMLEREKARECFDHKIEIEKHLFRSTDKHQKEFIHYYF